MEMADERGNVVRDLEIITKDKKREGSLRTFRVWLDTSQYQQDINQDSKAALYNSFNIILRRKAKENNFKSVLETIRDLMNSQFVVPDWLHDLLLGTHGHANYFNAM